MEKIFNFDDRSLGEINLIYLGVFKSYFEIFVEIIFLKFLLMR